MLLQSGAITEAELDQWWDEQDWLDQPSWESPAPLEPQPPVITELSESHINKLVELYIGYFGRAVESAGLDYHQNHLLQMLQSGLSEYEAFNEVAKGFWVSALQYDTVTGYDETMSSFDFIAKVYANVLGRPDAIMNDLEGINGWVQVMEQGHDQGEMVLKILDGAHAYIDQNPTENVSLYVNNLLENRTEISLFFAQDTVSGGLLGTDAIHLGVDVMNRIDHTQESVAQVKNALLNGTLYDLPEIELVGASVLADELPIV